MEMAFFCPKRPAAGSYYLMTTRDSDGRPFNGGATYRLTVPPGAPVRQYWSATAYDRETHALVRHVDRASRSSQNPELQLNPDGAAEIVFAPRRPARPPKSNWVPPTPRAASRCCSASTAPRSACSRRRGCCPTSRKSADQET
jgi:hypothetical protein